MLMNITQRFNDWYQGNNDYEKEPPRSGVHRIGYLVWNFTGRLAAVNLLFLLCCVPVVTIPAALSALNYYLGKMFREGYGYNLSDFMKEFKGGIRKHMVPGILVFGLGFYAYYLMSLAGNFSGSGLKDIIFGIGTGVMLIAVLVGSYYFVVSSMLELPVKYLLKNTLILIALEWKRSVLLVVETMAFWGLILAFMPYSVIALILFFSIQQLVVYSIVGPCVIKRITNPYENICSLVQ